MSSSRKRAVLQRAQAGQQHAERKAMMLEYQYAVLKALSERIAAKLQQYIDKYGDLA